MVLWIVLALMTGAAVLSVLLPLSRPHVAAEPEGDVSFYKAQLAEIGRDRERGYLDAEAAESARIESGRRLLKAATVALPAVDATSEPALRRRRAASALALSVVPLVGLALYGGLGSPQFADIAASARPEGGSPSGGMAEAVRKVEEHLAANPGDVRGWDVVAPIYLRTGRLADAARAFRTARELGGETPERLLGEGEALVGAADGVIEPAARALFLRVVALDPRSPAGRYYAALALEQAGDGAGARAGYGELLESSRPDAAWVPLVRARLAALAGTGPEGGAPVPLPPASVTPDIAAMVSGLDERLTLNGGTEAEWARLVRSFVVLGRRDDAVDRLVRARSALSAEPGALGRLDDLGRELGLRAEVARR